MNTFFKGKKLLVVGGTSGMGLAVARMVLEAGGSVVLTGNKKDKAEAVQKELSPLGPVAVIAANLMTEEGMETIRREINARHRDIRGQFGYRKLLYYKDFPGMSKPVFMVSVCSSVKIKGRDCGTINGHDESSSIRTLMKDAREVLVR